MSCGCKTKYKFWIILECWPETPINILCYDNGDTAYFFSEQEAIEYAHKEAQFPQIVGIE